jgi:hypothetical protein
MSRLIAPFALVMFAVFAACAVFGYVVARESDARHQDQRRAALLGVVDEFRNVFADMTRDAASDLAASGVGSVAHLARELTPVGLARYRHEHACVIDAKGAVLATYPRAGQVPDTVMRVVADFRAGNAAGTGGEAPVATEVILLDG